MTLTKIDNKVQIEQLTQLLQTEKSRFSHYQIMPECVQVKLEQHVIDYCPEQVQLDKQRFAFLINCLRDYSFNTVLEIGANIGYFSLNLAKNYECVVNIYEPMTQYVKAIRLMAEICEVTEKIDLNTQALGLDDLSSLPNHDLVLSLNVLHHAGNLFDQDKISKPQGWRNYFIDYLNELARQSRLLFLQTGNMWDDTALFDSEDAIRFIAQAISETDWQIKQVGVISDYQTLHYSHFHAHELSSIPKVKCRRNSNTNKVEYRSNGRLLAELVTGMAQRPLWFLSSESEK